MRTDAMFRLLAVLYSFIFPIDTDAVNYAQHLSDSSFTSRQFYANKLAEMDFRAVPVLEHYAVSPDADAETRYRCRQLLDRFYNVGPTEGAMPALYCIAGPCRIVYEAGWKENWIEVRVRSGQDFCVCDGLNWLRRIWWEQACDNSCVEPGIFYALISHGYYAKVMKSHDAYYWHYQPLLEQQATGLFCRDLLRYGFPKKDLTDLLDWMQTRSNPVPMAMPNPPTKWRHWATKFRDEGE